MFKAKIYDKKQYRNLYNRQKSNYLNYNFRHKKLKIYKKYDT